MTARVDTGTIFIAQTGDTTTGDSITYTDWWPYPTIEPTYPNYVYTPCSCPIVSDKGSQAFNIAKTLIDKEIVRVKTAKQFAKLMEALLETL